MILQAEGIYKSYGSLQVLKGINMSIEKGEIISIVGASGAGKSTLLHILGTLDKPDNGFVNINNTNVINLRSTSLAKFRNKYIGFVFQFHNLLPEFSAFENVCLPGFIAKQNQRSVEKEANRLLDMLGLYARKNHKPSELSGGEQQRTAVARALVNNPDIVFADEPSGNLDSKNANELHQLFFQLRKELDQTFVIITHNEELAKMADRILEMRDGVIVN